VAFFIFVVQLFARVADPMIMKRPAHTPVWTGRHRREKRFGGFLTIAGGVAAIVVVTVVVYFLMRMQGR
jgi:hypothetical protein